jgi:hypothetical protein
MKSKAVAKENTMAMALTISKGCMCVQVIFCIIND